MRIGIDFDNTIICYDRVFNHVGVEKGLIPEDIGLGKNRVRDYLRKAGREDDWTWLQGYVYGTRLSDATLYDGIESFVDYCGNGQIECVIISHKTRYPYSGDQYDLHQSAREFIDQQNLSLDVFFEPTKEEKVERIVALSCDWFIDDLPEFLQLPGFPEKICKILFDPLKNHGSLATDFKIAGSWEQILNMLKTERQC